MSIWKREKCCCCFWLWTEKRWGCDSFALMHKQQILTPLRSSEFSRSIQNHFQGVQRADPHGIWINCYFTAVCTNVVITSSVTFSGLFSFPVDNVRNLTLWSDAVFHNDDVIILHRIKRRLNYNNHIRRKIVELEQILIDLTAAPMLMNGVGCVDIIWVDHTFFLRSVSSTQTHPEYLLVFIYLAFFPWCLFPNRNATWNYSEWSRWIGLLAWITAWEAEEGTAVLTQRPTLMCENEQRLMYWLRDKCVPTDTHQFWWICSCVCLSAELEIISEWRDTNLLLLCLVTCDHIH